MIAWDNMNDEYYCATITDVDMAKKFYDNYKQYVDFDTGFWKKMIKDTPETPPGSFLKNKDETFEDYPKHNELFYQIVSSLERFNSGVHLVKIKTDKDAGGDIEYNYTSYGAAKAPKRKYITIKQCP